MISHQLSSIFYITCLLLIAFPKSTKSNICNNKTRFFRSDQVTVIINGYSEQRIPLLKKIAAIYAAVPVVSAVVVIWGNPTTTAETLESLSRDLSSQYTSGVPIKVLPQRSKSLNSRFIPGRWIRTRGVLICDDDVEVDLKSIGFAFRVWQSNKERLVGLFGRSHGFDLSEKSWIYTVYPDKYSIVLTKFMIIDIEYLYLYSCGGYGSGDKYRKLRGVVDDMHNCEDILMNFVVADSVGNGPILVGAEKVRDWGDARNEVEKGARGDEVVVGLSGVKRGLGEHRKRRGSCISKFHKILGRMPLRYSYGKTINSVSEQGLCEKRGKLVPCDKQRLV